MNFAPLAIAALSTWLFVDVVNIDGMEKERENN